MNNNIELPLLEQYSSTKKKAPKLQQTHLSIDEDFSGLGSSHYRKVKSYFQYYTYTDMISLVKKINTVKRPLACSELPLPYEQFNIKKRIDQINEGWKPKENQEKNSFMKLCLKIFRRDFIEVFLIFFLFINSHVLKAFLLGKIMQVITLATLGFETDKSSTIIYAILFAIVYVFTHLLETWWSYYTYMLGSSMRLSITGFLYEKLNKIASSSLHEISLGKIINLLTNDMNQLDEGSGFLGPMLLAPYSVILSFCLLWNYFGAYSILSFMLYVGILLLANRLSTLSETTRMEKNTVTDQRIKYTNEFIENIRLIKLYAWEKPLRKVVTNLRRKEAELLKRLGRLTAIGKALTETSSHVSILITCTFYVLGGGVLTPEKIYSSFLVLSFSKFWIVGCFQIGRMFTVGAKLTNQRIEDVLEVQEIQEVSQKGSLSQKENMLLKSGHSVVYENFTAYWSKDAIKPCLNKINLKVKQGQLVALIGKIGSGKTTFLLSFLKEIPRSSGNLSFNGSIAYVEQEPVIFSGSIRDNILFGQDFDEFFYARVLRACNIDEDLKQFDHGDQTIVGERGVTLSGGQKARLSLARALYAQCDIYLLDDPLSAVDSRVGKILFDRAIKELLRDKTVFLVTHHINYAKEADKVIVMNDGEIEAQGTFDELVHMKLDLLQIFTKNETRLDPEKQITTNGKHNQRTSFSTEKNADEEDLKLNEEKQELKDEDSTEVSKETYKAYIKASGKQILFLGLLLVYVTNYLFVIAFTKNIGYWAQTQSEAELIIQQKGEDFDNFSFIIQSFILLLLIILLSYSKVSFTVKFALNTNSQLHDRMLYKISRAPVSFFDSTPIGIILNRFSNDLGILDKDNWETLYDFIDLMTELGLFMVYLFFINYRIAVPCLVVIYSLYQVRKFFIKSSILLRRLELVSRSPIFSEISSTLNGLLIIRVYKQGPRFIRNFLEILFANSRAFMTFARTNKTFCISLQFFAYLLSVSGIAVFIYVAYFSSIEASVFGLALFYLILISDESGWAIRQTVFLDMNMQSAERARQYCLLPEETPTEVNEADAQLTNLKASAWPPKGSISFKDVYLRYPNTTKYALNGLSFTIDPKCKVGVVGRTGAGKSSIIQALFRIVEIEDTRDSHIKIDGVDTKSIGLETLRGGLSILPQTPVIFTGTIRRNLDPFDKTLEEELWHALEQVSLKSYVQSLERGLDTDMSISNSVFSAGQKQLLCLARVILRKSKVVILDEATANVDASTDNYIQQKINEIFKDCVVITIAHRLSTIAHYDKVLVLDKGMMVEYDHPYKLLVENVGDEEITREKGMFAQMVKQSGEKMAKEVFTKTYFSYFKQK